MFLVWDVITSLLKNSKLLYRKLTASWEYHFHVKASKLDRIQKLPLRFRPTKNLESYKIKLKRSSLGLLSENLSKKWNQTMFFYYLHTN